MEENNIFRDALTNFTHAAASGGAIEHLAQLGYVPQEIVKMLDFPTPYRQVQETYWNYLLKKKIIVEEQCEIGKGRKKEYFVTDHDAYGRKSFRRVTEYEACEDLYAYVSCDFGLRMARSPEEYGAFLAPLNEKQRLYMEGVPWRRKIVWHRMDPRMTEIIAVLQEHSAYHGTILQKGSE
jgi:hypothetical protein